MKRDSWKKKHKVEVIIVKPSWDELDPEEKEKILIAATGLYKAETRREEDVFTAWKERGDKYTYSDKVHPLIEHFRYLERKEFGKIPKVEFTNPWRLFIIAGILNVIAWGILIWAFRKIFF